MKNDLFTKKQIRQQMQLSENQLNYLLRKTAIEGELVGNTKVFSKDQFIQLLQARKGIQK